MLVGITGGTGFVGKALLLRHVGQGDRVRLLSRRPAAGNEMPDSVRLFNADLTGSAEFLKSFVDGVDVLYHCAGEILDQTKMFSVHVTGTGNLCAAARHRIGRWVQLSSVGVYGPYSSGVVTEEMPEKPVGVYETTKARSDQIVFDAARNRAFVYSMLRPSNIFGPAMKNRSIFELISMVDKGLFFFLGSPGASANYIHVDNVVEGLIQCGESAAAKGRIYNLSDYRTIEEFIMIIANELKKPVPKMRFPEKPGRFLARQCSWLPGFPLTEKRIVALTNRSRYSIKKIQDELGYVHRVSMEDGLSQMVMQKNNPHERR